jgi:hypothetical protein
MKGQEMKVEEIAEMIVDAIFSDGIVNRDKTRQTVIALIRSFVKQHNMPNTILIDRTPMKQGERSSYVNTITQRDFELKFWKDILRKIIPNEKMEDHFSELNILLLKNHFGK